jgi:hypothetical protein
MNSSVLLFLSSHSSFRLLGQWFGKVFNCEKGAHELPLHFLFTYIIKLGLDLTIAVFRYTPDNTTRVVIRDCATTEQNACSTGL